jgi:hypothetical protein
VLTDSAKTAGVLIGVAETSASFSGYRLVSDSESGTYQKRILIAQELTASQVRAVLFEPQNAFSVPVYPESAFEGMAIAAFSAEEYNS